jgi:hypothetical protein
VLGTRRKGLGVGAVLARRVLVLFVAAVMAVMMSMGTALASHSGGAGGGAGGGQGGAGGGAGGHHVKNNKVYVCHKGHTLLVTKKERNWHLNNHWRDYSGPCWYR